MKIGKVNNIYMFVVINICFLTALFSKELIDLFFPKVYKYAYLFVQLISFSYLFSQAGGFINNYFKQSKKMIANMYFGLSAATLNIILNFLLIPPYGPVGAAYATIISMAIPTIFAYIYTKKHCYFVPINIGSSIILVTVFSAIVIGFQNGINVGIYHSLLLKVIYVFVIGVYLVRKNYTQIQLLFVGK